MGRENFTVGGQAVIEGVMMRNKSAVAIALRQDKGTISVHKKHFRSIGEKYPFLKWPLLRGVVAFVEALILGYQSLTLSAEQVLEDEEEELGGWELPLTLVISGGRDRSFYAIAYRADEIFKTGLGNATFA